VTGAPRVATPWALTAGFAIHAPTRPRLTFADRAATAPGKVLQDHHFKWS